MWISHIRSTAISEIWAKLIINILVEIIPERDLQQVKPIHLHLRKADDNDELYFRDYLNVHTDLAKEYEKLKLSLWKQYEHNRDGYTERKTDLFR